MTDRLVIALAQLNPTVGAIGANLDLARRARKEAGSADLVLFPELFLCGYPPEDLVLRPSLVAQCAEAAKTLAAETVSGPAVLIGLPWLENGTLVPLYAINSMIGNLGPVGAAIIGERGSGVIVNVSFGSSMVSPTMGTLTVLDVSPGAKVSVPLVAV